jgi:hypothetical protein
MIGTPLKLEILLHSYVSYDPFPRQQAPAVVEAIKYLFEQKMIHSTKVDHVYGVTERGTAYIQHILSVPFPVCRWIIPTNQPELTE